ncbi:MAG: SLC13 family permease, partial [Alphaproteobacteria bacterium]|nr:SLC13 family permease [Alphaproteobacteria bacterium]
MILTAEISEFHMWVTFAFVAFVIGLFMYERIPTEISAALSLCLMITVFHFYPLERDGAQNLLNAQSLLQGFANPALITVISLIVVGKALTKTGSLSRLATIFSVLSEHKPIFGFAVILTGVAIVAAFMNNTPV